LLADSITSKKLKLGAAPGSYTYPYKIRSKADLPRDFTWGNVNGKNFLTRLRNQHIPQYCGSCWAHATTSVMSDRISIMRGGPFPEINIAVQPLLDFDYVDQGCHGGDFRPAFTWIKENGIVDEACSQYRASGWDITDGDVQPMCKDCVNGSCLVPEKYNTYTVEEHGEVPFDEEAMMTEIYERGPVGCAVYSEPLEKIAHGFTGVFETTEKGESDHDISVVGWGQEEGTG
jgi:cathepsin X